MRYVLRDAQGVVVSLHRDPVPGAEPLPLQHPDVQAFLVAAGKPQGAASVDVPVTEARSFAELDANLVRVLEDLIDALIRRNVLRITDLPVEAQAKLFERKHFREGLQAHALRLFGHEACSPLGDAAAPPGEGDALPDLRALGLMPPAQD